MSRTPHLEAASNRGFLWPPIADAVETFLRRSRGADAFERVWRLIHVWEATEITLALATLARLRQNPEFADLLRRQREYFYGKSWDPVTRSFKVSLGASAGVIDQWINILDEVAKIDNMPGRFLPALGKFLTGDQINLELLVAAWAQTCDVPPDFPRKGQVQTRIAMRCVNSFRNRFAHVPFPYDPLEEVSAALETATEELFSLAPTPSAHEKEGQSSPLTGAFRVGRSLLRGGRIESLEDCSSEDIAFVFPSKRRGELETWPGEALIYIDPMMRPHILTRVKGIEVCEYTRFRAEANAVLVRNARITTALADLSKTEYITDDELSLKPDRDGATADALEALRSGDYDSAIKFFDELSKRKPEYHVGWLRLGHSRREKAVRISGLNRDEAIDLLRQATDDLGQATKHISSEYRALAHYERSKAFYHLARLQPMDTESMVLSKAEAEEARRLSKDKKFHTWWEYLQFRASSRLDIRENEPDAD